MARTLVFLRRFLPAVLVLSMCSGSVTGSARGAHWPQQGGDAGRSGYQAVGDGGAPVRPLWSVDGDVVAAPLISAGRLSEQRVIYGTSDGSVHLRDLSTGRERGAAGGTPVDGTLNSGVFGHPQRGGVAFADSSGSGGLGLVFVVHNADNRQPFLGALDDVEVAVIDESTGAVVQDAPVQGTVDHRVDGPAALSPPDAAGARALLFLTTAPGGAVSLVRVPVDPAGRLGAAEAAPVAGADPRGGAALVFLPRADGAVELYAAVGAGDGVRTFSVPRFPAEGPRSRQPSGGYGTPAAPVAAGGLAPGQPGSGAPSAPGLYVAASSGGNTRVHRLEIERGALVVRASSPELRGSPAVAIAVAQEVVAGQAAAGWIVAGTSRALHVLDARSLEPTGVVGGSGFADSVAAAAGALAFTAQDAGAPVVVDLGRARSLLPSAYAAQLGHAASRRPAAQPAISRGLVIFATDRGVFAYRTRCGNAVAGTQGPDRLEAGVPGDAIAGFGGDDTLGGGDGDDCIDGGEGRDRLRGDAGDDTLVGGAGADRLDGGPGRDELLGGDGRDLLLGGGGRDRLAGGRGDDRVDGGSGDDAINVRGGGRDRVRCGPGRDTVLADRGDGVLPGCERVLRR